MSHLIVIPAYNEEQALPMAIADLQRLDDDDQTLEKRGLARSGTPNPRTNDVSRRACPPFSTCCYDILIVNDGSTDRTRAVAEALGKNSRLPIHILNHPVNCGIGAAVQAGYRWAAERGYEYVIQFDGDGQHDAQDIPRLINACRSRNLDLCIGSRFLEFFGAATEATGELRELAQGDFGSRISDVKFGTTCSPVQLSPAHLSVRHGPPWVRRLGTRWLSWLISCRSSQRITDATSGLRCASPRAVALFAASYPADYPEPVTVLECLRRGLRVGEIAVKMRQRQGGVSSITARVAPWYMLTVTWRLLFPAAVPVHPPVGEPTHDAS